MQMIGCVKEERDIKIHHTFQKDHLKLRFLTHKIKNTKDQNVCDMEWDSRNPTKGVKNDVVSDVVRLSKLSPPIFLYTGRD